MNPPRIAVGMLWLAMAAGPIEAGTVPQLRVEEAVDYYDVTARNRKELIEAMRVPGLGGMFQHAHGLTHASITIERQLTQGQHLCSIESLRIRLALRITLPRWTPGVAIPATLRKDWNTMRDMVARHENRHRQNALNAAFAIRDRFAAIPSSARCASVEAGLKRQLDTALLKQRLADQFLDQRTGVPVFEAVDDHAAARAALSKRRP